MDDYQLIKITNRIIDLFDEDFINCVSKMIKQKNPQLYQKFKLYQDIENNHDESEILFGMIYTTIDNAINKEGNT